METPNLYTFAFMPLSGSPVTGHLGTPFALFPYLVTVTPPGVLTFILLRVLERCAGRGMTDQIDQFFKVNECGYKRNDRTLDETEALITGVSVSAPLLITVDQRLTHHGGTTPGLIRD